jgi:hypothetical protein
VQAQHPGTAAPEREHIAGGFGHGPHNATGGNGYGSFNAVTAQAMMAWALMQRCGLAVDRQRFEAAHAFIAKGTNPIGYVWYADGVGGSGYADMGRTGTSALAHFLDPAGSDAFKAFGKRNAKCIGNHVRQAISRRVLAPDGTDAFHPVPRQDASRILGVGTISTLTGGLFA